MLQRNLFKLFHKFFQKYSKSYLLLIWITVTTAYGFGQETFHVYSDDFVKFCKTKLYISSENLKDTLPSGRYYFYNVTKENSHRKKKKIVLQGNYVNGVKEGLFFSKYYSFKKSELISFRKTNYKKGKRTGIEEEYQVCDNDTLKLIPKSYYNYLNGNKDGICIEYENGVITSILLFKEDKLVERFLGDWIERKLMDQPFGVQSGEE